MSEQQRSENETDALARALAKADGKVWWTEAFPAAYRDQARNLLADGWRVIPPGVPTSPTVATEATGAAMPEHVHQWTRRQNVTSRGYAMPPYETCDCGSARTLPDSENDAHVCSCGNAFDGDNLCMPSACQWEGIERPDSSPTVATEGVGVMVVGNCAWPRCNAAGPHEHLGYEPSPTATDSTPTEREACGDVLPLLYGRATCVRSLGHDGPHREALPSNYTSGAREWGGDPTEREAGDVVAAMLLPFVRKVCTCHMFSSDREPHRRGCETLTVAQRAADALAPLIAEREAKAWDEGFMAAAEQDHPTYPRTRVYANPYQIREGVGTGAGRGGDPASTEAGER